jgi:hypothetical protein
VRFQLTASGDVTYDRSLEPCLGGAGTATFRVNGFLVSIDATALSVGTFRVMDSGDGADRRFLYRVTTLHLLAAGDLQVFEQLHLRLLNAGPRRFRVRRCVHPLRREKDHATHDGVMRPDNALSTPWAIPATSHNAPSFLRSTSTVPPVEVGRRGELLPNGLSEALRTAYTVALPEAYDNEMVGSGAHLPILGQVVGEPPVALALQPPHQL